MARVTKVSVAKNRCKGCGLCVSICPKQVLVMSKDINDKGYFYATPANPAACTGCRFCAFMCPDVAITIEQEEPAQKEKVHG